ncbi:MAG: CvpA family protein [Lentimicrobiaceae bacterium]|jgi:membrane protein required for colicin V production|nr:CvpA family protein [Lentimicrobiaceae bacterium]
MNYLDIIILIILLLFAIYGFSKGLIVQLFSLAAIILGSYFALFFSEITADFLVLFFDIGPMALTILSFILTFLIVVIVVVLIGKVLDKIVDVLFLGFFNRLAGSLVGAFTGVLIISLLILFFNFMNITATIISPKTQDESVFFKPIEKLSTKMYKNFNFLDDFEFEILEEEDSRKEKYKI